MPKTITLTIPDVLDVNIGGKVVSMPSDEVAHETFLTWFHHGKNRKCNDTHTGKRHAAIKAGVTWTDSDDDKLREEIVERCRRGDWGTRESAPVDPVGKLARDMAKMDILIRFAKAAGVYREGVTPRAKNVFESLDGPAREKMRKAGEVDGKTWTWDMDTVDAYVESNGFRAKAEKELKRVAEATDDLPDF